MSCVPIVERLREERDRARAALRLPLLVHGAGPWTEERREEWRSITGTDEATTRVMCDTIRALLARIAGASA